MIRVAVIDDNPAIVFGLKSAIQRNEEIELMFSSSTVTDFFEKLATHETDVLVVDLVLADVVSLNFLDELRSNYPDKKIIAYSNAKGDSIELFLARIGVSQLVSKTESLDYLMECILQHSDTQNKKPSSKIEKHAFVLSDQELKIIHALGKGFSSGDIADQLTISHNTVNFYKKKLLKKFKVATIAELVIDAVELGILRD